MTMLIDDPCVGRRDARIIDDDVAVATATDGLPPRAQGEAPTFKPCTDTLDDRLVHAGATIWRKPGFGGVLMQFFSGKQLRPLWPRCASAAGASWRLNIAIH
ncbi:hypothetical protein [Rhodanobacter sp. T12-5]|uniref:hypothetical protein n=1 Tax=Rhodanobacter sp. T12-5 TaxID=2024611 RepID=UPI001F5BBE73|nr:hypothetical protein [Rhodanobacter sp. T12-5]